MQVICTRDSTKVLKASICLVENILTYLGGKFLWYLSSGRKSLQFWSHFEATENQAKSDLFGEIWKHLLIWESVFQSFFVSLFYTIDFVKFLRRNFCPSWFDGKKAEKSDVRNNFVIGLNFELQFDERTRITWWLTFPFQIINIPRREIGVRNFLIYNLWL